MIEMPKDIETQEREFWECVFIAMSVSVADVALAEWRERFHKQPFVDSTFHATEGE